MNKNAIFLFIIIALIAAVSLFSLSKKEEASIKTASPSASPANGLVAAEPKQPETPISTQSNPPEVMTLTPSAPATGTQTAPATAGQPAVPAPNGADDVPASAEVAPAPTATPAPSPEASPVQPQATPVAPVTNPTGMPVPASEGQNEKRRLRPPFFH